MDINVFVHCTMQNSSEIQESWIQARTDNAQWWGESNPILWQEAESAGVIVLAKEGLNREGSSSEDYYQLGEI